MTLKRKSRPSRGGAGRALLLAVSPVLDLLDGGGDVDPRSPVVEPGCNPFEGAQDCSRLRILPARSLAAISFASLSVDATITGGRGFQDIHC